MSNETSLTRILSSLPSEVREELLARIRKIGLQDDDDPVFQVAEILGIYAVLYKQVSVDVNESVCIVENLSDQVLAQSDLARIETHIERLGQVAE